MGRIHIGAENSSMLASIATIIARAGRHFKHQPELLAFQFPYNNIGRDVAPSAAGQKKARSALQARKS